MVNMNSNQPRHELHLQAAPETYRVIPMGYFFTLPMNIAGLDYHLNIDTGSSDIFIKGENSPGQPEKKYTCPVCMRVNKKLMIFYLDGGLRTYIQKVDIKFG